MRGLAIRLPRRALRRRDFGELEPRMIGGQRMNVWPTAPVAPRMATRMPARRRSVSGCHVLEKRAHDSLIGVDRAPQLLDLDELVGRVRDVNRSGSEHQRRAPPSKQRNIGRVGDRRDVESRNRVKVLRGDIRAILDLRPSLGPKVDLLADWFDVAHETEHQLGFGERRE